MDKKIITREFDELFEIVKKAVNNKNYNETKFLASYIDKITSATEKLLLILNKEVEALKSKSNS
ncbi:MAG: hypothetical protein U9O59_08945 [Actinomycetota bacterium]|nr:hypothetical protein [Actinomycetota bacterium]